MSGLSFLYENTQLPKMAKVRQKFECPEFGNLQDEVARELARDCIGAGVKPGMSIAVGVGSRGVANIKEITLQLVTWLKDKGALPFIIPAMGSHGGATAAGQIEILASYGVTEEYCGCPIRATMETVIVAHTPEGLEVHVDKYAAAADGIVVINRIKPHTSFRGPYESGLMKILTIGLGKQKGAETCHNPGFQHFPRLIPLFGTTIMQNTNFLFGLGTVENSLDETCVVRALTMQEIIDEEPALQQYSKDLMPKIYFDDVDVLIIDSIGKNFSGDGMDPNITGTFSTPYASGGVTAQIRTVLDISDETCGNALGLGMADIINKRVFEKMDLLKTYPNAITSKVAMTVKIPMMLDTDEEVLRCAVKLCNDVELETLRIVRIPDSMHLEEIWVSESLYEKAKDMPEFEIISPPAPFDFGADGNLV